MLRPRTLLPAFVSAALLALAGCSIGGGSDTGGTGSTPGGDDQGSTDTPGSTDPDQWADRLQSRHVNYPAALRTAALRLTGALPTVEQVEQIAGVADPAAIYQQMISAMVADPRFQTQMLGFWRDTFKMGGSAALDAAPLFATQLTVSNGSSDQLFTATTGACPTLAGTTITPADCSNGAPVPAGVLTNPGMLQQFVSNMAFRRTRWVEEVFDCTAFPAEV